MEEIKNIMLGHSCCSISIVIVTPLKSTFRRLKEVLNIEKVYDGAFFENCIFKIDKSNKQGIIILSPQGIAAQDIIELFSDTSILFFGLAGSLSANIKIGDFVEVKTVVDVEKNTASLTTTGTFRTVKCGYSPCMLGALAKKYCNFAKSVKCDVVDMETTYCAKTAIQRNNRFTSLLLISDIPEIINFWGISKQEQKKLKDCRIVAIDKIVNYINILVKES